MCRSYFVRFQRTPAGSDLAAIQAHRTATAPASMPLDIDTAGEITQFLGTLLLLQGTADVTGDDKKTLLSKMSKWKKMYRGTGRTAELASERCSALLTSRSYVASWCSRLISCYVICRGLPSGFKGVKDLIQQSVDQCGLDGCTLRRQGSGSQLMQCGRYVSMVLGSDFPPLTSCS
jgi:hypothetical protein